MPPSRALPMLLLSALAAGCARVEPGEVAVWFTPEAPHTTQDLGIHARVSGLWEDLELTVSRPGLRPTTFGPGDLELVRLPQGGVSMHLVVPAAHTARRQAWTAEIRARYGRRWVEERATATVQNSAPELRVTLDPQEPTTVDMIRAVVDAVDVDGDPIVLTFAWWVNGERALSTGPTLPAHATRRDSLIQVRVAGGDGDASVEASARARVINAPPTAPSVQLGFGPVAGATLPCLLRAPAVHADGVPLTYEVSWWIDDEPYTGPVASGALPGDTIQAGLTRPGQIWSCVIRAFDGQDLSEGGFDSIALVDGGGPRVFTPCGATGPFGPTEAACHARSDAPWAAHEVAVVDGIQRWTPPFDGRFRITAAGAEGAWRGEHQPGGLGAVIAGTFELSAGEPIDVLVGQPGLRGDDEGWAGGGGGTFVTRGGRPLLVAGGGGGGGANEPGCDAVPDRGANDPVQGDRWRYACIVRERNLGHGGLGHAHHDGAGGGGFYGSGEVGRSRYAEPGASRTSGGAGGRSLDSPCSYAPGGFGGGGSGDGPPSSTSACLYHTGAGGGGGFSGGGAGPRGGGGGSFNLGDSPEGQAGANAGPGWVRIEVE